MRRRDCRFQLRLTEAEMNRLKKQSEKCGLKPQAYIIALIENIPLRERPSMDLVSVLRNLQQINNNMNQIAMKANSMNFIDTAAYWKNVDALKKTIHELLEVMYG